MRHQSCNASQPIRNAPPCCSVPTLPWLRSQLVNSNRTFSLDNFALMDVVVKALVADSWVRQEQAPDADAAFLYALHVRYLLARHAIGSGDILNRSGVSVSLRLMMFRGLYDSVRTHGFDWVAAPIPVDRDYRRLDGGHRIALALTLNQSRVGIRRECFSTASRRAHPQNLDFVRRVFGARSREAQWVTTRAEELLHLHEDGNVRGAT